MGPTLGDRVRLIEQTQKTLENHLNRLATEIRLIVREISLDIEEEQE